MKFAERIINKEMHNITCRFEDFLKIAKGTFICE